MKLKKPIIIIIILVVLILGGIFFFDIKSRIIEGWTQRLRRRRRRRPPAPPRPPSTLSLIQIEAPTQWFNAPNFTTISNDSTLKTNLTSIYNKLNQNVNYYGEPFTSLQKVLWVSVFVPSLLEPLKNSEDNSYNAMLNKYPKTLSAGTKGSRDPNIDDIRSNNYDSIKQLLGYSFNLSAVDPNNNVSISVATSIYDLFYTELQTIVLKL